MAVSDRRVVFSNSTKNTVYAGMAELADAQDSGSNAPKRLFLWLPNLRKPSKIKGFRAFPLDLKSSEKTLKNVDVYQMSTKFPKIDLRHAVDVYHMRSWRNWQTRQIQVLVGATRWRFKSSRAHQRKPLIYQGFSPFLCPFDTRIISTITSLKSGRQSVDRIRITVF